MRDVGSPLLHLMKVDAEIIESWKRGGHIKLYMQVLTFYFASTILMKANKKNENYIISGDHNTISFLMKVWG